jgi:hypothetical protein
MFRGRGKRRLRRGNNRVSHTNQDSIRFRQPSTAAVVGASLKRAQAEGRIRLLNWPM